MYLGCRFERILDAHVLLVQIALFIVLVIKSAASTVDLPLMNQNYLFLQEYLLVEFPNSVNKTQRPELSSHIVIAVLLGLLQEHKFRACPLLWKSLLGLQGREHINKHVWPFFYHELNSIL